MSKGDAYVTAWKDVVALPTGIKRRARSIARSMALSALGTVMPRPGERFLRPIYCHYVFDDEKDKFEQLIAWLKKIGTFVDTDTCIEMLEGKQAIDGRYFHLSFDDGFRNVATNALPILKKHEVPAIIFVPSSVVGADWTAAREYCRKTMGYDSTIEMVRWEDLTDAVAAGFEVGSHGRTHVRFSDIPVDAATLDDEIRGSRWQIQEALGTACKYIAWPDGRPEHVDRRSLEMIRRSGYRACFGGFRGSIIPRQTSRYAIPRHQIEMHWPISHIRCFAGGRFETRAIGLPIEPF
jgi:peptidoglycan/xylan/chitin deacetylase (PgdA/CDA1 family)